MHSLADTVNSPLPGREVKRLKIYVAAFAPATVFAAVLWYMLVCAQQGVPTASSQWISGIYARKLSKAESVSTPKMEIVGGSSSLFGISAARVEAVTGIPTVNMGTHAGLGLEYILSRVKPTLHRGDVACLCIEYELYGDRHVNDVLLDYVFSRDPAYFKSRMPLEKLNWAFALSPARVFEGYCNRRHPPDPEDTLGWYSPRTINDHGDETANTTEAAAEPSRQRRLDEARPSTAALDGFSEQGRGWSQIAEFKRWCDARGVRVVATFPNMLHFPAYDTPSGRRDFLRVVESYKSLNIPTLGTPSEFLYGREDMYDAVYHMNTRGVTKHTGLFIRLMESHPRLWEGLKQGTLRKNSG